MYIVDRKVLQLEVFSFLEKYWVVLGHFSHYSTRAIFVWPWNLLLPCTSNKIYILISERVRKAMNITLPITYFNLRSSSLLLFDKVHNFCLHFFFSSAFLGFENIILLPWKFCTTLYMQISEVFVDKKQLILCSILSWSDMKRKSFVFCCLSDSATACYNLFSSFRQFLRFSLIRPQTFFWSFNNDL